MVVGRQASLSVRGTEGMTDSKSATTGPPLGEVVALAKEDSEGRAGGSPQQQDDVGNAVPASQFRITSVAQVEGEEAPLDPLETSVNDGLRASVCLSDSNSLDTEQTDAPDPLSPVINQRPPSPVEEVLQGPAPQNHHSLRLNGSHLTTQQSQQQGSSRFRKVAKYLRERWQVEDSVETDRSEEGKSSSAVVLSQTAVLLAANQSGSLVEGNSLTSSSSPNLSTAGSERWDSPPVEHHELLHHEKAAAESRPPSKLATHEAKVLVQLSPQHSIDPPPPTTEAGQLEPLSQHNSDLSQHSGASSPSLVPPEEEGRESSVVDVGEREESRQHEGLSKSTSSSGGMRTPVTDEGSSKVQDHMGEVGDVLAKLQHLYGAISNEHIGLVKQLRAAQLEVATLKEKQKALKRDNEAVTKENERLRSRLQKFENRPSRTAQNDHHKDPGGDPPL